MSDAQVPGLPSIESAFQPILSLAHQASVGYEALLRATHGGAPCSPEAAFGTARRLGHYAEFERACTRHHVQRFVGVADPDSVLFVNLHPDVLVDPVHGPGIAADIVGCGMPPSRVVIEILEAPHETTVTLADAVARLRQHGFLIALDDFGAGLTNLGRVWDLCPDVVKLDRELIRKAVSSFRTARSLLRLVDLLHDIGTFIVVEGVETEAEARLSSDCDADFVQGYYFGRPSIDLGAASAGMRGAYPSNDRATSARKLRRVADMEALAPYRRAFEATREAFCAGRSLEESAAHFLRLDLAVRVFLLDEHGMQVGGNIESDTHPMWRRAVFPLLARPAGANWSKRAYFVDALAHPGATVVSEPFMSASSTNLCVTLSAHIRMGDRGFVLGGDVFFDGLSQLGR